MRLCLVGLCVLVGLWGQTGRLCSSIWCFRSIALLWGGGEPMRGCQGHVRGQLRVLVAVLLLCAHACVIACGAASGRARETGADAPSTPRPYKPPSPGEACYGADKQKLVQQPQRITNPSDTPPPPYPTPIPCPTIPQGGILTSP